MSRRIETRTLFCSDTSESFSLSPVLVYFIRLYARASIETSSQRNQLIKFIYILIQMTF